MIYLLLGQDTPAKDQHLKKIRSQILQTPQAERFDYEVLYGHKLDGDDLSKALKSMPAVAPQRVVVIHQVKKLSKQNEERLLAYVASPSEQVVLVMDDDELEASSAFVKSLPGQVKVITSGVKTALSVFDVTNAMSRGDGANALKCLNALFESGVHPLQVIGGLTWYWGKRKEKMAKDKFKIGLLALQETDLNIKRSRMKPDYAVECLVMKLLSYQAA